MAGLSGCWRQATLDANPESEAPADSIIKQSSPSLLLNRRHFSVSFPLPLELKPPFCSKTCQAKEILLPFLLTNSPLSSASRNALPTGHRFPGACHIASGTKGPPPTSLLLAPHPWAVPTLFGLCLGHSCSFPRLSHAAILFRVRARHPITP